MKRLTVLVAIMMFASYTYAEYERVENYTQPEKSEWIDEAIEEEVRKETYNVKKKLAPSERKRSGDQPNIYIVNQNRSQNDLDNDNDLKNDNKSDALSANDTVSSSKAKNAASNYSDLDNQPATYVEASPLTESKASVLRELRQSAEIQTEQKIVEKLEASRLDDERRRANRLFGNAQFTTPEAQKPAPRQYQQEYAPAQQPAYAPVQQPVYTAPVQQPTYAPTPAPVYEKPVAPEKKEVKVIHEHNINVVKEEVEEPAAPVIVEDVKETVSFEAKPEASHKLYVSLGFGAMKYHANNVESKGGFNLGVGYDISDKWAIEGSLMQSAHVLDDIYKNSYSDLVYSYGETDIDQTNIGLEARYKFGISQKFVPYIGGYVGMARRTYKPQQVSTTSVNLAPTLGVNLNLSKNFSIGADCRYMMGMGGASDSQVGDSGFKESPLEEISYTVLSVKGQIRF